MEQGNHSVARQKVGAKLLAATVATLLFVGLEIGVAVYANSLALLGDAFHNFTDAVALLIALVAYRLERSRPTQHRTYGFQRAGILAAFVNASTLLVLTIVLFVEAWQRFRHPEPVDSGWMLVTAAVAVVLNGIITVALRHEGRRDVSIRSAVIHMFGDALSSAGIIVAALLIRATGNTIFDPLITVGIGAMILWTSWGILRESLNLLLDGTPAGIDPDAVARDLAEQEGVEGVHHLHIWAVGPSRPALSCHVEVANVPVKVASEMLPRIAALLQERYGITHTTIQFEHAVCSVDDPFCILSTHE